MESHISHNVAKYFTFDLKLIPKEELNFDIFDNLSSNMPILYLMIISQELL